MNNEKILEKIQKLLEVTTDRGASENEAMMAALKAQKLMAENDLTILDIQTEKAEEVIIDKIKLGKGNWKFILSSIIARNFSCKVCRSGDLICLVGFKRHVEVANKLLVFLFNEGKKLSEKYYQDNKHKFNSITGVKQTYLDGFCCGLKEVLDKQCTALQIVIPKEVEKTFSELGIVNRPLKQTFVKNADTRAAGITAGRNLGNARAIKG